MRERTYASERGYDWIVYAVAMLLIGGLAGYVLAVQGTRAASPAGAPAGAPVPTTQTGASSPAEGGPVVDEAQLRAYRDILARDPKNLEAAENAANLLYDGGRYAEAVPLYERAAALAPADIDISTDLGTALWYSGRADAALAQYDKSLALDPTHAQTLFNSGIVRSEGKRDYAGAVAAWEKLLAAHPDYSNAARVRQLIADANAKR